jgi:hypothetical protein
MKGNTLSLRHTLATLAYRGGKAMSRAPRSFARFKASPTTRTPLEIVTHLGDLMDWGVALADGKHVWHDSKPREWEREVDRFFVAVKKFDKRLASRKPLGCSVEGLFQGPVADALTHIGQIALLRRVAGAPVRGENYFKAEIVAGRVGKKQQRPVFEFD